MVYPRVCGGTGTSVAWPIAAQGLSPRVRGNLCSCVYVRGTFRSIPACAGEPMACGFVQVSVKVYPRVCGGTLAEYTTSHPLSGLSPRVRGNLQARIYDEQHGRSIPACAGEPGCSRRT